MSHQDFSGKTVLVTGGAKNVGKAIARRFAERGAHVILNFFHSLEESRRTRAELEALGARVDVVRASVAQKDQVDRMFDEIAARHGRIDVLVNNAASGALLGIGEIEEAHFDRALDTNLKGAFWCSRRAAALMPAEGGAIVNVSSVGATLVPANYLVVGTSKAALESLTRYLAAEYAPRGIRVNTASATLIDGDVAGLFPEPENTKRSSIRATPMKRLATADDMADLVAYLASPQARFITGQVIVADGGLSLCNEALSPRPEWSAEASAPAKAAEAADQGDQAALAALHADSDDIAIVGMGLALPGASDPEGYWRVLMDGPELFSNVPADRWDYRSFQSDDPNADDKSYQSHSVYLQDFSPLPRLAAEVAAGTAPTELTTLWLRHALMQSLEGVRVKPEDRASFFVGYTADGSQHLEESMVLAGTRARLAALIDSVDGTPEERTRCLAAIDDVLKRRYRRGAEGLAEFFPHRVGAEAMRGVLPADTDYTMVDTACSSSLYSVDLGIKCLLSGQRDVVACGGSFGLAPRGSILFAKLHGLSRSGEVRPLDKQCDGVLFADGAGVVVLKRLSRALADGDRVLAVVKAFGSSSDGKGKAIYAPSSAGQCIAIGRAYEHPAAHMADVDWIVAHATGTPAGDMAEFQSLRESIRTERDVMVTSNKSLIGHTGWAAGVVSLIQVVLGLQKQVIPPQHRYDESPADFKLAECRLRIPKVPVPWQPRAGSPRTAAVSGFGFGGTNGHMVVQEFRPDLPASPRRERSAGSTTEPIVVVAWSAKFPGLDDAAAVRAWLRGEGAAPLASFGEHYPIPPFEKVRMPPAVLRAIDRCQLMVLDAASSIQAQLPGFWAAHARSIGVVMGHMGPTRNAALFASRSYLDDIGTALASDARTADSPLADGAMTRLRAEMNRLIAPPTENSFPGMMPNVISSRIANYFDLNGLNMTVDTGHDSAQAAFDAAAHYLRAGEIDMAIVGGINGSNVPEILPALAGRTPAEGLAMFAVMTESTALAAGLTVLARIDQLRNTAGHDGLPHALTDREGRAVTYLGADAAVAALRTLCIGPGPAAGATSRSNGGAAMPAGLPLPPALRSATVRADGRALQVSRHEIEWREAPQRSPRPGPAFLAPNSVLVTGQPELIGRLGTLPADLIVLSTAPLPQARAGWHHLPVVTEEAVGAALEPHASRLRHLRVLASMPPDQPDAAQPALLALHDLAFLALKHVYPSLGDGGSAIVALANAVCGQVPHPASGLFTGLFKALAMEKPGSCLAVVLSDSADPAVAAAQAEREAATVQHLPAVMALGERRLTPMLAAHPGALDAAGQAHIGPGSVVVAFGGARGITAELLKSTAQHFRPTIYLIGSNPLADYPAELFEGSDEDFQRRRAQYIRDQRSIDPALQLVKINKAFDRMVDARAARRNIEAMKQACGADRVHYLCADVLDAGSIGAAVARILEREPRIDLVINAAGLNRSAFVPVKSLAEFKTVRDIKALGYWNLRHAFGTRRPRLWCNFGSLIGHTGQSGETDYAAGNDLLNSMSAYHRSLGEDEFTIGWTLWATVGLGANPVTQAFLDKAGLLTAMSTEDGVHLFLREVSLARRGCDTVHLGERESRAIATMLPGYFDDAGKAGDAARRPAPGFYLGRRAPGTAAGTDDACFERVFDLDTDAYLQHHLVNGYATLPGTFVPEIAAEAALQLRPGACVVGFEDAVFHHFLRVYDARRPSLKRIFAKVVSSEGGRTVVQVRVVGDVVAPTGQVLTSNKLHFEIKVLLAASHAAPPRWEPWPEEHATPVADPYHVPAAPVLLSEMFVSTADTRFTPRGKRARYALGVKPGDPVFSRFVVPSILLDGLARVAVLNHVAEHYVPLAAPATIRRIDLYEAGNDLELAARHPRIELYATPAEFALEADAGRNRFVAALPDGRMVMQMQDVTGVVIGYVHRGTGAFVSRQQVETAQEAA